MPQSRGVLVTYADDDGAAAATARLIGDTLVLHGLDSTVRPVAGPDAPVAGYDAVVVGSSVHGGHWLRGAVRFVQTQRAALGRRPVWLFSNSGPGDALVPAERIDLRAVEDAVAARDHHPFPATPLADPRRTDGLTPDAREVCGWAHLIAAAVASEGADRDGGS